MNPPQNRGYPVPFVKHSVATNQPQQASPPIVMDVQRLIEHMKGDFRTELQAFKVELLTALQKELADHRKALTKVKPEVEISTGLDEALLRRVIQQTIGERLALPSPQWEGTAKPIVPEERPLFVPSDLLAPREGTVAVHTSDEGAGNLDDASEALRKMKRGKSSNRG